MAGFLYYAAAKDPSFFVVLAVGMAASLLILIYGHFQMAGSGARTDLSRQDIQEQVNLLEAELAGGRARAEGFRRKISDYSQLQNLTEQLCENFHLPETQQTLSRHIDSFFHDQDVTIIMYLFHTRTGELSLTLSQKGEVRHSVKAKQGDAYDHWVIRTMTPLLVEDVRTDFRFDPEKMDSDEPRDFRSLICVPLVSAEKAVGLLRVDSPVPGLFTAEDLRLLTTVAGLGTVAVENAQLYERIEDMAVHDGLTGLLLRRYLLERLTQEIGRELRSHSELTLMMIDLDHFKQYNDSFGHTAGDLVLKTVAGILAAKFSEPGQLVSRFGGEEFAVLLPDCPREKAMRLADELCEDVAQTPVVLRRQETRVTISVGVAVFPHDAQIRDELIQRADEALYRAKNSGRNRVCAV